MKSPRRNIWTGTLFVVSLLPANLQAGEDGGSVYQRQRRGGGYSDSWNHSGRHHGGHRFYGGYPSVTQFSGSWYARSYPYHFDYYRWRYSAPPQAACPCQNNLPEPIPTQ